MNFNASSYSDCQLANALYHYNHICIIVLTSDYIVNFKKFCLLIYFDCQITDTMLTKRCMMYSISHECTRPLLDSLEYNNKSNQIKSKAINIYVTPSLTHSYSIISWSQTNPESLERVVKGFHYRKTRVA